ncbi:MAG: 30S ribosomal protein S8 [Alphaproteobacteria bacterium RIFCSPLOWO2_01_FULL_40_26]|nr:MAG: 30S ribosomal protein S8 [Alphaproteobacteria bacterium RIFCSPHIGHO2_02_FULL_40_34]OFW87855.1 MAG: 30S ribosomal protein S8 [Alphaproteobacteria bacterium RIFCSPHIGHO2_01_FULL_40_8]OFW95090.1 MAG: 30S ribosomal protein S8 [Alphaproteobacteria bacterium RIFCSPLOWO2_01_FULL_40_26]OFX09087.1 MAG: 30S ribosomal protein S8 [Alphaproteobacteria bacterium RIFCSPLOWO2_02_FULL_40_19]OFX12171.1 MAG: 30S ribosomal protein S8 [Alphaproteobacteria bacterium RIFCSPLOWO2_12_FULL_40_11]
MFFNHPVSDLVARIKNGYLAKKNSISSPVSRLRENILHILKDEGYILNYSKLTEDGKERFDIHLKYHYSAPVVSEIEVVSKPGRRVYCHSDQIPLVKNGLGLVVLSTSGGVIADHEARSKKLGGEILLKIF